MTKESVFPVCHKPYHINKKSFVELCLTALVSASGAVPFSVEAAEGDIRQGPAPGEAPLLWNDGHVRAGTWTPRLGRTRPQPTATYIHIGYGGNMGVDNIMTLGRRTLRQ